MGWYTVLPCFFLQST